MAITKKIKKSNIVLGNKIARLRLIKNMTCMQLGRKVNQNKQQIERYECGGAVIPLPVLEKIACALDEPIAKKIIRKISSFRKLEVVEKSEREEELIDLYNQAFPDDILA
ncbi:MAG: helix-turn-helix transcriptional regulator [Rickettsiales bacterium]|jgi:transcriptional regulator with XRE-family HTH domain|nr:helix-turn-helix transcriptional regulator [Rickettsiales bacterium]